jgi:hypothetical protein
MINYEIKKEGDIAREYKNNNYVLFLRDTFGADAK